MGKLSSPALQDQMRFRTAIEKADKAEIEAMLADGFPIDAPLTGMENGLIIACRHGNEPIARFLLEKGTNVQYQTAVGLMALHYACKYLPDFAIELMEQGADPNKHHKDKLLVPLISAIEFNHERLLDYLLDHDVNFDVCNEYKESPCIVAVTKQPRFLPKLIEAGANVNYRGKPSEPVLFKVFSLTQNSPQVLTRGLMLMAAGASTYDTDEDRTMITQHVRRVHPPIADAFDAAYRAPYYKPEVLDTVTRESLLGEERSLLQNPRLWWNLDTLLTNLEAKGERLTADDLSQHTPAPDGGDYLSYGVRCLGYGMMHDILQAHGDTISPRHLVDAQGEATGLLREVISQNELDSLFSEDYWQHHSVQDMRRFYHALPEKSQADVPIHQLTSWKKRVERQQNMQQGQRAAYGA